MSEKKSSYAQREERILQFWNDARIFRKTLQKTAPQGEYIFYEGPPTANGRPGIHHLASRAFKDALPRYKTMRGFYVRRKAGWDTHGLPVELEVEKQLGLASKKDIEKYGIEAFNEACRGSVWTYLDEWQKFTERIGYWLDMDNPYVTYHAPYVESVWWVMKQIFDKGYVYKDYKIVPWCPRCGTGLSSHELAQGYADVKDISLTAKFKLKDNPYDKPTSLLAWTTTPWTLPGNIALAVGKDITYVRVLDGDEYVICAESLVEKVCGKEAPIVEKISGESMIGWEYEPLFPYLKERIADGGASVDTAFRVYDAEFVTTEDGTGIVHTAVMYGQDDFELGTQKGLPKIHIINPDGTYIDGMGELSGRYIKEETDGKPTLDIDIIKHLQEHGTYFAKEKYEHNYPHCWRCKTPLVYYARDSWYINMQEVKEKLIAENESIEWHPAYIRDGRFGEWLRDVKDWAISRERYWGTPLPLWQNDDGELLAIGGFDDIYTYAQDDIMTRIIIMRHGESEKNIRDVWDNSPDAYPLTDMGIEQVRLTADELKQKGVDIILTSPVLRARQTAELVAEHIGAEVVIDERLTEIDSGQWDGKTYAEVAESRDAYNALEGHEQYTAPRGTTGESWSAFNERIASCYNDILETYRGKTVLCVGHFATLVYIQKQYEETEVVDVPKIFHRKGFSAYATPFTLHIDARRQKAFDPHRPFVDDIVLEKDGHTYARVSEVMDVWFDSGAMPFAQDHYRGHGDHHFPADFIAEGMDQTRGWFYTMHAIGNLLGYGKAYKHVMSLGLINDADGQKMSKSKGNTVNPWDAMNTYGADTIRFWMYSVSGPGDAKSFDEKTILETQRKVFGLFDNVVNFYELYAHHYDPSYDPYASPHILDTWVLSYIDQLITTMTRDMDDYKLLESTRALRGAIADISQWYIRRSRDRFKDVGEDMYYALATTRYCIDVCARLLAPFAPFFAEDVYQRVDGEHESVHLAPWPDARDIEQDILEDMDKVRTIISQALELRASAQIKVRQPLESLTIPHHDISDAYYDLIQDEVNIKEIKKGDTLHLDTELTEALEKEGDMRECIRMIQSLRKKAGLHPDDVIITYIHTDQSGKDFIQQFHDDITSVTNTKRIEYTNESHDTEIPLTHTHLTCRIEKIG